jgi:nitrogen fixation protein NifB
MNANSPRGDSLPCFSPNVAGTASMLWLPVAPACNMRCIVCSQRPDRAADSLAVGTALPPDDAVARAVRAVERGEAGAGVLLWGPGEPLVNASTYVVLRRLQWLYPDLPLTVCTNGILLPDRLEELVRSGVRRLVISINAVTASVAESIYESVTYRTRRYGGAAAAALALQQQWNGLENAVDAGLSVTVYTALLQGINDQEQDEIARRAQRIGAERIVTAELDFGAG